MDILISNSGGQPIYDQITQQIRGMILAGTLPGGEPLPSIRFLAKELRISVITVKRAYEELERGGLIETVGGKGSFVTPQNTALLREAQLRKIEELFQQAITLARGGGVTEAELRETLELLLSDGPEGDKL